MCFYDASKGVLGGASKGQFTTPSNCAYVRFSTELVKANITTLYLYEGHDDLPYQEYNGAIAHKVDITPVLLWQNGNPNGAFSGGTITLADSIWNYKTIRIAYKPMWCTYEQPIEYKDFEPKNDYMNIYGLNVDPNENMITSRNIEISNNTSVKFHASYDYSGSSRNVNNNRCIPIAIYGIK
jgi:hypothetical protein